MCLKEMGVGFEGSVFEDGKEDLLSSDSMLGKDGIESYSMHVKGHGYKYME